MRFFFGGGLKTYYKRHLPHYQPEDATFHVVFRLAGSLPYHVVEELREERDRLRDLLQTGVRNEELASLLRKEEWGYFRRFDALLNGTSTGPHWLRKPEIAEIVKEAMHYRDQKFYDLIAFSIMPNHVHMIVENIRSTAFVRRVADPTKTNLSRRDAIAVRRADSGHEGRGSFVRRVADPTKANLSRRDSVPSNGLTDVLASLKKYTALRANRALHRTGPFWQSESYDHVIRTDAELERTIWYVLQNPVNANLVESREQWPWNYCKWNPE